MTGAADLLVVGAGAKATAVAAKIHVLNTLGHGPLTMTIVEGNQPAASWTGLNGMTSGDEPLAITPVKDVGFPYDSAKAFGALGEAIDRALLPLSWQQHLVERGIFGRWVNAGSPSIRHRDYGEYLKWVLDRATEGVTVLRGRVEQVSFVPGGDRWVAEVAGAAGRTRCEGRALMLTGPGVHRHLPHDVAAAPRLFHCDSKRGDLGRIPAGHAAEIAIIGGGESALSCLHFLRAFRPDAQLTVYTPTLPMSRGESFLENRVFADPDCVSWSELDLAQRRSFVKHCDRGVFDAGGLARIAYDDHCRFVTGRVEHLGAEPNAVRVDAVSADGRTAQRFDYAVNCTGFDLLEQLRGLFPPPVRAAIERRTGPIWDRPPDTEIPIGRSLELAGLTPRLHIPGLSALAQGPGFANLGSMGLLANRVLQPLLDDAAITTPVATAGTP